MGSLENQGLLCGVTVPMIMAVMISAALSFACNTNTVCEDYKFLLPDKRQTEKVRKDFEMLKNNRINTNAEDFLPEKYEVNKIKEKYKYLEPDKAQIEKVKRDFEKLKNRRVKINTKRLLPTEDKIKEIREKYKHLTEFNKEEIEKLKDALLTSAGQKRVWESVFKTPSPKDKGSKEKVIFYLFSRSVPATTVDNVFSQAKKLKGIKFYGVIRGIDREALHYITSLKNFGEVRIKINPLIFEKVGAEVVPAFVFAECRTVMGILRAGNCEFKAVLYGDVSLEWAVERYEGGIR